MTKDEQIATLQKENDELKAELEEVYAEPVWFSASGDYLVLLAIAAIIGTVGYYLIKIGGGL